MLARYIFIFIQSLTSYILPIALIPLVISYNDLSSFGTFSYCLVIFQIVTTFVDFGISTTGVRQVYQGFAIFDLISTKVFLYIISLPFTIYFLNDQNLNLVGLYLLPLSSALNVQFVYNSLHLEKTYSILSSSIKIAGLITFFSIGKFSLENYSILLGTIEISTTVVSYFFLGIEIKSISKSSISKILKYNIGFLINNLSSYPYTTYPIIYLKLFTNSADAGTYAALHRITNAFSNLSAPFNLLLLSYKEATVTKNAKFIFKQLMRMRAVQIFFGGTIISLLILGSTHKVIFTFLEIPNNSTNQLTFNILLVLPLLVSISRLITVNILIPLQKQNFAGFATIIPGIMSAILFTKVHTFTMLHVAIVVLLSETFCTLILFTSFVTKSSQE